MMNSAPVTKTFFSSSRTVSRVARPTCRVSTFPIIYGGKWVPNKSHPIGGSNEFHFGPHIMFIGLAQEVMQTMNPDRSGGEPYVR